jgi:hypothetical protein
MQSNSKLTSEQKQWLEIMIALHPEINFAVMGKTTIAFKHLGELVEFATAICADNEKKQRDKVGKHWALSRFDEGQTVKMPKYQFDNMLENEESLALWG